MALRLQVRALGLIPENNSKFGTLNQQASEVTHNWTTMTRIPGVGKFCPRGPGQPGAITATRWRLQNLPQRPHAAMVKLLIITQGDILPRRGTDWPWRTPIPSSELLSICNSRPLAGPHPPALGHKDRVTVPAGSARAPSLGSRRPESRRRVPAPRGTPGTSSGTGSRTFPGARGNSLGLPETADTAPIPHPVEPRVSRVAKSTPGPDPPPGERRPLTQWDSGGVRPGGSAWAPASPR